MIEIPYWWDGKKPSLMATIHKFRPDLIKDPGIGTAISYAYPAKLQQLQRRPGNFINSLKYEEVPPKIVAKEWNRDIDVIGW